jgi:hypothetical protein
VDDSASFMLHYFALLHYIIQASSIALELLSYNICDLARFFTHQSAPEIPPTNPETTRENPELLRSDLATQIVAIDN